MEMMRQSGGGLWRRLSSFQRPMRLEHLFREKYLQIRNVVTLRKYQEECIRSVLSALEAGHKRLGISLATGSGKTVIFTQLIDRIKPVSEHATQTLILAHRRGLVEQAARHCMTAYPQQSIEIEMGSMHASGTADITVASVRSIISGERLGKFDPKRFKLVLVDEAHHIVAPGYLETLQHFGLDRKHPSTPTLVGVSATFSRFDGLRLGAAIDEIVYHKDYVDMIGDKWLSDVVFTTVESTADLSRVRNGANGDFLPGQLSKAINTNQINEITVRSWMAKAVGRKSTLVFCVDIAHVKDLTQEFRKHRWDARFVTGDTPQVTRGERLEAFRKQEFPVLVNCGVFTEGTDIPNVDCVVLARPTRSRNLLVQMIGRGMRLHPGKENCHVLDMVSTLETGIVTTPTLFGLDPGELVEAASLHDLMALKERKFTIEDGMVESYSSQTGSTQTPQVTFTEYESVLDLIADTSSDKYIRQLSHYAWVQVGPDKYVLAAPSGSFIRIEKKAQANGTGESLFRAVEVRALPAGTSKSPYAAPRELIREAPFAEAVRGSDKYASEYYPHTFIHRYQAWRKLPPTENQLKFLNKIRGNQPPLMAADLNKGKAVDMITKIKHGARGRFAELEAEKRRLARRELIMEQEAARKQREQVVVGPLSP